MQKKIQNALISVSDKSDLNKVLYFLKKYKISLISSGGTFKEIKKLGYDCTEVAKYTKFNEMLDGRVKTLHPKIHAGILNIRSNKKQMSYFYNHLDIYFLILKNLYFLFHLY